jgi:serine/threonine protein kinase
VEDANEYLDGVTMNPTALSPCRREASSLLEWVDLIADRFEQAWASGSPPPIVAFLGDASGERRAVLLHELVKIDLERRLKAGQDYSWEDYLQAFPELRSDADDLIAVVASEANTHWALPSSEGQSRPPAGRFVSLRKENWPVLEGFDILCLLGHGGMGTVYKARQQRLKRLTAVKVLHSALEADPKRRARFRTEAEATARLQHPNIAQLHEIGEQDGIPYLVMEYVEGGSLGDCLRGKPQSPRQAAELTVALARAMHYAHQQGVVHRDLKPDNILLQLADSERERETWPENGAGSIPTVGTYTAKITDFGLAKLLENDSRLSLSGAVVGTPSYMAPEQAEGKSRKVGPAVDIYALGAILYEMLTGRPPFLGDSILDILEQVRRGEPMPPSQLRPKLPRDLETICLKALARSASHRYADAGALANDLERFLKGEPIQARPVGGVERLVRWCRRRPAQAGLTVMGAALATTVVVASVLLAVFSTARERSQRREGLLQQLQLVRAGERRDGWSDQAWKLIAEAAKLRNDAALRSLAAAACSDLDARPGPSREWVCASWLTFDSTGQRLLLGGKNDNRGRKMEGAKLWEIDSDRLTVSWRAGAGPVAFGADGTPLQLTARDGRSLLLWNLQEQKLVREIRLQPSQDPKAVSLLRTNVLGFPLLTLSPQAAVGAVAVTVDGRHRVLVWDAESGKMLFPLDRTATALALSPKADLLAVGDEQGSVTLWTIPAGKPLGAFQMSASSIHNATFSPNGKRLAVADAARSLTVWDVKERLPLAHCRGAQHDVYALAFSDDGTLLASGGRGPSLIWDAATGRQLLGLRSPDLNAFPHDGVITALAFAPGGQRLSVGS